MKRNALSFALCVALAAFAMGCSSSSGGGTGTTDAGPTQDTSAKTDPGPTTGKDTAGTDTGASDPGPTTGKDTAGSDKGTSGDTTCTPQCADKTCGPNGCGGFCGLCNPGEICNASGKCEGGQQGGTIAFGEQCGHTADCAAIEPPDFSDPATVQPWLQCLNQQCKDGGSCNVPFGEPVCTRDCVLGAADDQKNNVTGASGPDGVEDAQVLCNGAAADGPYGANARCIRITNPQVGQQDFTTCAFGTDFKDCKVDADCPSGESCQINTILGVTSTRCATIIKDGKKTGEFCESNEFNPSIFYNKTKAFCAAGTCFGIGIGCSGGCVDDAGCNVVAATCTGGKCSNNTAVDCSADEDCSPWLCNKGFEITSQGDTADLCFPKNCLLDGDCIDEGFFCRTFFNGENDPAKAGWDHMCLRKPAEGDIAKLGEACDADTGDNVPGATCENPIWCLRGQCSTHCASDADCATGAGQICGVIELPIDIDDNGAFDAKDAFLPLGVCEPVVHTGDLTECTKDADCTEAGEACTPVEIAAGDTYTVKFYCAAGPSDTATGAHGDQCGGTSGVDCINGTCLNLFQAQDGSPIGACLATCRGAADCPEKADFLGGQAGNFNGVCISVLLGWNGTADPNDNLYMPVCVPESTDSSRQDCASASQPGVADLAGKPCPANETCQAFTIATTPDVAATVEFLCINTLDQQGNPPAKKLGESCTAVTDCTTSICLDEASGSFCSTYCDPAVATSCDAVPGTACAKRVLIPRADEAKEAAVWMCQKTDQSCAPCSLNTDCAGDFVCANVAGAGGAEDFRCVPDCGTNACDTGTCGDVVDRFGQAAKGCSTTCQ